MRFFLSAIVTSVAGFVLLKEAYQSGLLFPSLGDDITEAIGELGKTSDGKEPSPIWEGNLHHKAVACAEHVGDVGLEPPLGEPLSVKVTSNGEAVELARDLMDCHADDLLPVLPMGQQIFSPFM